jgi:hypothetical protein
VTGRSGHGQRGVSQLRELAQHRKLRVGIGDAVALIGQQQRRQVHQQRIVVAVAVRGAGGVRSARPARRQRDAARAQRVVHRRELLDAVRVGEIDHQQRRIRGLQCAGEPGHRVLGRHGRKIDELEVHVGVRHHPRLRQLRREGIRRIVRRRAGESRVQQRLARVGGAEERDLGRALAVHDVARRAVARAPARRFERLGQFPDARLEIGLQALRALVLGNGAQHLA